jgi:hypothetical protein
MISELADASLEAYLAGQDERANRLFDRLAAIVLPQALEQLATQQSEWIVAMLQSPLSPGDHLPLDATTRQSVLREFLDDLVWEYVIDDENGRRPL